MVGHTSWNGTRIAAGDETPPKPPPAPAARAAFPGRLPHCGTHPGGARLPHRRLVARDRRRARRDDRGAGGDGSRRGRRGTRPETRPPAARAAGPPPPGARGRAEPGPAVVAVERDPKLVAALRAQLAGFPRARVVESDILETRLDTLAREAGVARWRVYGNLPYYITSPILQHLFASIELIADIHIVVQREVAERLAARPGSRDYGYLSVLAQFQATPEILLAVPRGAFRPPPKVESVLVRLVPPGARAALGAADGGGVLRFVGTC